MSIISHGRVGVDMDARIAAQVRAWEEAKKAGHLRPEACPFVTVSREFGCEGLPFARRLAELLNDRCKPTLPWVVYDRELLDRVATELHLHRDIVESLDGHRRDEMSELFDSILNKKVDDAVVFRKLAEVVRSVAIHGHAVIVGRGSAFVTQDLKTAFHARLIAPRDWRIHKVASDRDVSYPEAEKIVDKGERERQHYASTFFVIDPRDPFHYDLMIDNSRFNLTQIGEIVLTALKGRFGERLVGA